MESILGKLTSGLLALLAAAAVVFVGYRAIESHDTNSASGAIAIAAANINAAYANNTAGYGSLNNAVVLSSQWAPDNLVRGAALVAPWGSNITVSPVGTPAWNFQFAVGATPAKICSDLVLHTAGLVGAMIGSTQMTPPFDVGSVAAACASGPTLALQFGRGNMNPSSAATLDANAQPAPSYVGDGGWGFNAFGAWIWSTPGFYWSASNTPANLETLLVNNSGAPQQIYLSIYADNYVNAIKLNGTLVAGNASVTGALCSNWSVACAVGPITLPPGTSRLNVDAQNGGGPAGLQVLVTTGSRNGPTINSTGVSPWYTTTNAF